MGWNGIGIGWPNASAYSGPAPATERYLVESCVNGEQIDTELYDIGDFEINDRVTYDVFGNPTFGKVIGITENEDYAITITSTGVNSDQCYDNYVVLNSGNRIGDTSVAFVIEINSTEADFISNNEYAMNVNYVNSILVLVYVTDDEGDNYYDEISIGFSGSPTFNTYFYEIGGDYKIVFGSYSFPDNQTPIDFYNQEIFISVSFQNIDGYSDQDGCPNYSFLRNSGTQAGSSFNMSYRNDDC